MTNEAPTLDASVAESLGEKPTRPSTAAHLLTLLLILLAVGSTAGVAAVVEERISPIDEATHMDYAYRMSVGGIPRRGERISQPMLDEWACRGFHDRKVNFVPCQRGQPDIEYRAQSFPGGGYNYNQFHTPLYYAITGPAARLMVAVTPIDSFVTAARLVGTLWISAGLFVAYAFMLELGVSLVTSRSIVGIAAFMPILWQTGATVTNDNPTVLASASIGLVALWVSRDRAGPGVAALVALVAMGFKTINGLAIVAAVLFLTMEVIRRLRAKQDWQRVALSAASMAIMVPVVQYGWKAVQQARTFDPDYKNPIAGISGVKAEGTPFAQFFSESLRLFTPSYGPYGYFGLNAKQIGVWLGLLEIVLSIAPFAIALSLLASPVRKRLAASTIAAAILGAWLVTVQYWMSGGFYLGRANPRYGMSLLVLELVCVAFLVDATKAGRRSAIAMAFIGAAVTVPQLIGMV